MAIGFHERPFVRSQLADLFIFAIAEWKIDMNCVWNVSIDL